MRTSSGFAPGTPSAWKPSPKRTPKPLENKENLLKKVAAELARKAKEGDQAKEQMEANLAQKSNALEERAKARLATERAEMTRLWNSKLETTQEQVLTEIESKLAKLTYMPLGMRVSALIVDAWLLAIVSATVRFGTAWGRGLSGKGLLWGSSWSFACVRLSHRGESCLGSRPGRSAPTFAPPARPALPRGSSVVSCTMGRSSRRPTSRSRSRRPRALLMELFGWIYHPLTSPQGLPAILAELLKPDAPALPGVVMAATLVWWAILVLSLLLSPWIHMGTPYFRNTTLVESMWRVGFQRFPPPRLKPAKGEPAAQSG